MKPHREAGADIAALEASSAADLRRLWADHLGGAPPSTFSARLMRLALAWRIQADRDGGESPAIRRQWQAVMRRRAAGSSAREAVGGLRSPDAQTGTRLMKAWRGETHEVIVLETGVLWQGRTYASLSAVARAMTGTPRNGPKFFGLREGTR
ncbi:DUF2924 domain-containing protein [Seohaeicola zhoushanensis]|uniref:DUF2924 domain-containing protein n=1 Tax=Seohaeicola zhoushanensis TaxID=1569283 RepID=UPI00167AD236|nr:DUF2924 domain-containing protein [Seohaeicola zhoushanensis]